MDPKLKRKLIVSIGGIALVIALLVPLYILYGKQHVQTWLEARQELKKNEKRLEELRKAFDNQRNPQIELTKLREEVAELTKANNALQKLKTAGTETNQLPKTLDDPDPEIRKELYNEYMKPVMETSEEIIKERLRSARISPPEIKLFSPLENAEEAAYYMNRAKGMMGLIDALANSKSPGGSIAIGKIELEEYEDAKRNKRREGAINIMSYDLKLTMDTLSFVSFLYNLREGDNFYYIEEMNLVPRRAAADNPQLEIQARINTTMVFQSQVQAQVKKIAAATGRAGGKKLTGFMAIAGAMAKEREEYIKEQKERKWWQVWKMFGND
ncbi:MAG: hypothetical protein Kow0099_22390 [Candidatus Abyssubacteria bacterium]